MIEHAQERLAQTAKRLGAYGETIEETSGAFALFAGPESPVDLARGDFYPANVKDIAKFYEGRRESWTAVVTPV